MGREFILMILKIVVFLPFILGLIYLSLKYGGTKLQDMQNGKYIRILERVALSKDNSLVTVKIGDKGYIVSSTTGKIEILLELSQEELLKLEAARSIQQYSSLKDLYEKLKIKKEDRQ